MIKLTENDRGSLYLRPDDIYRIQTQVSGSQVCIVIYDNPIETFFVKEFPEEIIKLIEEDNQKWRLQLRSTGEGPKSE